MRKLSYSQALEQELDLQKAKILRMAKALVEAVEIIEAMRHAIDFSQRLGCPPSYGRAIVDDFLEKYGSEVKCLTK